MRCKVLIEAKTGEANRGWPDYVAGFNPGSPYVSQRSPQAGLTRRGAWWLMRDDVDAVSGEFE